MAVASAGLYASLHLAPDRQPRQHPTTQFFTSRMPFLPPNQQRQSTEGISDSASKIQRQPQQIISHLDTSHSRQLAVLVQTLTLHQEINSFE